MKNYFSINKVRLESINLVVTLAHHCNPQMSSNRGISTYMSRIVKTHACASCGNVYAHISIFIDIRKDKIRQDKII